MATPRDTTALNRPTIHQIKCNGNNAGVSTWGPWTAASHWAIEPVYGYNVYTVALADVDAVICLMPGYTGSSTIYDGGFIALVAGEEITTDKIASINGEEITVTIDNSEKVIYVAAGAVSNVDSLKDTTQHPVIYDLAGRKIEETVNNGVYIVNGKKYIKR